jgi:tetratricopeptide (TPR) repeat protein
VFFGRDAEFFILERALHTQRVVVIHGIGGVGKTELAKAFARWLQVSGGLSDSTLVFFHSFEPGLPTFGLELIVNKIAIRFVDVVTYLSAGTTRARAEFVLDLLCQVRGLLIWDNFESVASMPQGGHVAPPLDEAKKMELVWFISELRKTKSALLITSRSREDWIGGPETFARCEVSGLSSRDALQYARHLLAPHADAAASRANEPEAFEELINYLGGHPLSLKLMLPRLSEMSPTALMAALKGQGALPVGFGAAEGRQASLATSLHYSLRHLSLEDQGRIVILAFFENVASAAILGSMEKAPAQFQGLDPRAWDGFLRHLSELGLVTNLGGGLYRLHPTLPPFLRALWQRQAETNGDACPEREATLRSLIGAAAYFAEFIRRKIRDGLAEVALSQIATLRQSLGAFLGAALDRKLFSDARLIILALIEHWTIAGLVSEARAWGDRAVRATEPDPGGVPEVGTDAHDLWVAAARAEASRAFDANDLEAAEGIHRRIAESYEGINNQTASYYLAASYHELGTLAYQRHHFDEADRWYRRSLEIKAASGDKPGLAVGYHQLGILAENRGDLDEAERLYNRAIAIREELDDQPNIAGDYHQLGNVALRRGRLDEAEVWHYKALSIRGTLGNQPHIAQSYHQLGLVAQSRGHLDDAEDWYRKSLAIKETLGNRRAMISTYSQLGMVAHQRGHIEEAKGWYRRVLAMDESNEHEKASTRQLWARLEGE